MIEISHVRIKTNIILTMIFVLILTVFEGCKAPAKLFTIGMVNDVSVREMILDGFKEGMAELGYMEGKNVNYIYNGATGNKDEDIDAEIKKLLSQNVDILLVLGNTIAFRAQKFTEGTDMPIVVVAMGSPVEAGLVESLSHPGGNITGVQMIEADLKALEWFKMISPEVKKVYMPYDAADGRSLEVKENVKKRASQMGVEFVLQGVQLIDEAAIAIENLPEDIDAVYRVAAPGWDDKNYKLSQAAIDRGLPMVSAVPLDEDVFLTSATSVFEMGKQAARFADQIRLGVKPADLPVETAEVFLTINMKTAEKIGLHVPDAVLMNANKIIR